MMIAFLKAPGHTLELIDRAPASKGAVRRGARHQVRARRVQRRRRPSGRRGGAALRRANAISPPVTIDQGPNKGRKVVYVRDWDGVTIEFIEVATK